jgi:acetyl-CoA acetyltransferase
MTTRRAAIVAPMRTPVGTFGGSLRDVAVEDLAATAVKAVLGRAGIDLELIDAAAGCDPATMGIGPVPAVEKLFYRTGLGFSAMDLVELNEAFAVQVLAVLAG